MRTAITSARRVVVKAGSSSLTTPDGAIDAARIDALVDALTGWRSPDGGKGREVVFVSSGAIAAGMGPLGLPATPA